MKSYIHFIRHGITEGNLKGWYYGAVDIPLAPEGIAGVAKLKEEGIYPPLLDADCYTSGMKRAEMTFEIIYGNTEHKVIPNMREMNFGDREKKTFDEIKLEEGFDQWVNDKTGTVPHPNGDSIMTFYERINAGLSELRGYHRLKELSHRHSGQDAVSIMVCHGGSIAASMEFMFPGGTENFWQWIPDPGHGYTVYFTNGEPNSFAKF